MTPEILARLRQQIINRRLHVEVSVYQNPHPTVPVDIDDLQALIDAHDHYRAEFFHHSGGGDDCDCVELHDKWARGEIE